MKALGGVFALVIVLLWSPLVFVAAKGGSLEGWNRLWSNPDIVVALQQSLVLALATAVGSTVIGTMTAFVLPELPGRAKSWVESTLYIPLALPEISLGLALLVWFIKLSLPLGWTTLLIGHIGFCFTYSTLVMKASVETLDVRLMDAARDLGAGPWTVFRHAVWPQLLPGIIASMALCFGLSLDDFLITFFIKGMDQLTLPLKIFSMLRFALGPEIYTLSLFLCGISLCAVLVSQICFKNSSKKHGF